MSQHKNQLESDLHLTDAAKDFFTEYPQLNLNSDSPFVTLITEAIEDFDRKKGTHDSQFKIYNLLAGRLALLESWGISLSAPVLDLIDSLATQMNSRLKPEVPGGKSELTMALADSIYRDTPENLGERVVQYLRSELSGFIKYNPSTGAIEITSHGASKGVTSGSIYPVFRFNAIRDLGLTDKALPTSQFKELVMVTATRYFAMETPKAELERKLKTFSRVPDMPNPQELREAPKPPTLSQATEGPWAKIKDLVTPLWEVYGLKDDTEKEHFFRFLVALAARASNPGCSVQWALTLSGNGGTAKTSFGTELALSSAPSVSVAMGSLGTKSLIENISGSSLLILDELDNYTRKKDIAELKDFITASHHKTRKAYRQDSEQIPASWVFLATTNSESLPNDDGAEMRRWAWVRLSGGLEEGKERFQYLSENRDLLHALGYLSYLGGYSPDKYLVPEGVVPMEQRVVETPDEATTALYFSDAIASRIVTESGKLIALGTKDIWNLVSNENYHPRKAGSLIASLESKGWTKHEGPGRKLCWVPKGEVPGNWLILHPDQLRSLKDSISRLDPETLS